MTASTFAQPLPQDRAASAAAGHCVGGRKLKGNWHVYPEMAAAGLWTTPADLARFGLAIQSALTGKSTNVLSAEMARQMLTPQIAGFGLGLFLAGKDAAARFFHPGGNEGYRCQMVVYHHTGQGAVVMINSSSGDGLIEEILGSIAQEYAWPGYDYSPRQKTVIDVDPQILARYCGWYKTDAQVIAGWTFRVKMDQGRLLFQISVNDEEMPLHATSETDFFTSPAYHKVRFMKDTQGELRDLEVDGMLRGRRMVMTGD